MILPAPFQSASQDLTPREMPTDAPDLPTRTRVLSGGELAEEIAFAWDRVRSAIADGDKGALRTLHVFAKRHQADIDLGGLKRDLHKLSGFFPEPNKIDPHRIEPELVEVGTRGSVEGRLFRLLRSYWSMPFSKGYGRRLRFLVMDKRHEALIGIIGLQSPSADLKCRDDYFGTTKASKLDAANTTLDAYTVGAAPTYGPLLAGKLVAGLIHSEKVRLSYWRKYAATRTLIEDRRLCQPLLAVTTTSAFGRSSIYNRLRLGDQILARPLGYTRGFGTIHLEALYPHIVAWLKDHHKHVPAGFGHGPKARWQNVMNVLTALNIPRRYLEHGLKREVFIFEFASNLANIYQFGATPRMQSFDDQVWFDYWKERWCETRVARDPNWSQFSVRSLLEAGLAQFSGIMAAEAQK